MRRGPSVDTTSHISSTASLRLLTTPLRQQFVSAVSSRQHCRGHLFESLEKCNKVGDLVEFKTKFRHVLVARDNALSQTLL